MSPIETLTYTLGVFSDLLTPDLAECWTQQLGRRVELPEKLNIMALTQNELDQMRKDYCESVKVRNLYLAELPSPVQSSSVQSNTSNVSTACLSSFNRDWKSPYVNAVTTKQDKSEINRTAP